LPIAWRVGACLAMVFAVASADELPKAWQARNLEPIGYVKLQGPRAFKLSVARRGEHWYLFVGQGQGRENSGPPGFEVIDVSDPAAPRVVKSVSLPAATGQISSHGNLLVVGEQIPFSQSGPGSSIEYPFKNTPGQERTLATFWDVTDPRNPVRLSEWRPRGYGTHRNVYPGGAYAFMSAWIEGFHGQSILVILDVSGVPAIDSGVARHLLKTVEAARLMGTASILSGVRPEIAQSMVHLGIELGGLRSRTSLKDALQLALRMVRAGAEAAERVGPRA